jgi:hypothetical protein
MTTVNKLRARRARRKRILRWVPSAVIVVGIVLAVALTLSFNNSWWTKANPVASANQQFDGQSLFTQAGIDYAAKEGVVKISLASDRPSTRVLGLPSSGDHGVTYIVPLTVEVSAAGKPFSQDVADHVHLTTEAGRVSAIQLSYDGSYPEQYQTALQLVSTTAGTAGQSKFAAALQASRGVSRDQTFEADSTSDYQGMAVRVELAGTADSSSLTVTLSPPGRS